VSEGRGLEGAHTGKETRKQIPGPLSVGPGGGRIASLGQ